MGIISIHTVIATLFHPGKHKQKYFFVTWNCINPKPLWPKYIGAYQNKKLNWQVNLICGFAYGCVAIVSLVRELAFEMTAKFVEHYAIIMSNWNENLEAHKLVDEI